MSEMVPGYQRLPNGISIDDLSTAIARSGYPLQAAVSDKLRAAMSFPERPAAIQDEWTYIDTNANQVRSIDIFAEVDIPPHVDEPYRRVAPKVNVLAECKQSEMPYVFFLRGCSPRGLYDFPEIVGLPSPTIKVICPGDAAGQRHVIVSLTLHNLLEIWDFPYFDTPTLFGVSLSKAARRPGGKLELTGEEAYRSLTYPLQKASDHLKQVVRSPDRKGISCRIIICLAVLRAPMYGVIRSEDGEDLIDSVRWTRMSYLEPSHSSHTSGSGDVRYYDVVHEEFLAEYMTQLMRDVIAFSERIAMIEDVIVDGKAKANGLQTQMYKHLSQVTSEDGYDDIDWEHAWYVHRNRDSLSVRRKTASEIEAENL